MSIVKKIFRDYGSFVVDIPEWEIADKGVTALWGASGSGKSSCLRLLLGLEPCQELSWTFKEEDIAKLSPKDKRLGVVFQESRLFPNLSVERNLSFPLQIHGFTGSEMEKKITEYSRSLNIDHLLARKAGGLSGGEAQRVSLARALIFEPRILLLDEPFSALDQNLKSDARKLVKDLVEQFDIPALLISHDKEDLDSLASHVVKIENGKLIT